MTFLDVLSFSGNLLVIVEHSASVREQFQWRAMLLFGLPGSGKGTQGKALGTIPGFLHVASGEIFRQLNRLGQYGKIVSQYTSQGKLVPDELTIEIFRKHVSTMIAEGEFNPEKQIILLDGIPRTIHQAQLLAPVLDVVKIFYLKLRDDQEALKRIMDRARKEGRYDDVDESVVRGRLDIFYRETLPTANFYDPSILCEVDASQRPMQVLAEMANAICDIPVSVAS